MEGSRVGEFVWLDGKIAARDKAGPSVASSTFHMGSGVFDGLMAYWNRDHWYLHLADEHFTRFRSGCERMGLTNDWSTSDLRAGAEEVLASCARTTHYIRPIAFRGAPEILLAPSRALPVSVCMFAVLADRDQEGSLTSHVSQVERLSSRAIPVSWKICGAYANSFLAQTAAQSAGFDTAIFLDRSGRISEASVSNVFFIDGERLITPSLDADVFPGLTRDLLIASARAHRIPVQETDVHVSQLHRFRGAFVCSTLMEVRPLSRIGDVMYASSSEPLFRQLLAAFRDVTHEGSTVRPGDDVVEKGRASA
jgi:branched-chain amino acid aminotransferase